jgi:signal transduction histidine kinase
VSARLEAQPTTNQAAIATLFRVVNRYVGNLPPMPGVFPDYPPQSRKAESENEIAMMRWGMPAPPRTGGRPVTNIRNTSSQHWRTWLKPEVHSAILACGTPAAVVRRIDRPSYCFLSSVKEVGTTSVVRIGRSRICRKWLFAICAYICFIHSESVHATQHKDVLILHSVGREFRPWNEYAEQIRAELDKQSPWPLDVREHALELAHSGNLNPEQAFVEYLEVLYADHLPDLIVAIGAPAAAFVQRHRDQLFPTSPVLFTAIEQRRLNYSGLTGNEVVLAAALDFRNLFESFLEISPDTKTVVVVNGHSPNELFWRDEIQKELRPLENRIGIKWYDNLSFQEILKQTVSLPPHSAIFWNTMVTDVTGATYEGDRALTALAATANAPIFTHDHAFFGRGVVGGPMLSASVLSKEAGAVAVRILGGEKAGEIKAEPIGFAAPVYDWRELRRWKIRESRLPSGSEVLFRDPSVWEKYRWQVAFVGALVLLQSALIAGLLYEHRRRQVAELQSRQRMSALARANRFATAGELTASIAHEINQPLGAIQTNTETLDVILQSSSPDMVEVKEIIADIRRDQERASEVIRRLRSLFRREPFELKDIDLNEIVRDTEKFLSSLSALAVARHVNVSTSIAPEPLPIKGDRIQLQQVILNLIVNAMDAMAEMPSGNRKIMVRTTRVPGFAEVAVSDTGPGIPPEKLRQVFEPFFTTKEGGMGIGLSIVRTIVEAHHGRIVAENQASGGAIFRIRLPTCVDPL